jgi:hypothetical protein
MSGINGIGAFDKIAGETMFEYEMAQMAAPEAQMAPMVTPEAPMVTPEAPMVTPEASVTTPQVEMYMKSPYAEL